jgi:Xaa-Pro dipeptidase
MGVEYEIRYNYDRLRNERLQKAKDELKRSDLGALLCFDLANIRYITSTYFRSRMLRYCILPRGGEPVLFEASTATTHRNVPGRTPWLEGRIIPAINYRAAPKEAGITQRCVEGIKKVLQANGVAKEPLGVDRLDVPLMKAFQSVDIEVENGNEPMMKARMIKTQDEIELLDHAAMIMDVVYSKLVDYIRPGIRENDIGALFQDVAIRMGGDDVVNCHAISGPRTNPHPHFATDRALRPGDLVFFDGLVHYMGYTTCYYRTFSVGKPTMEQKNLYQQSYDALYKAIRQIKPGATTWDLAKNFPTAHELGYASEDEAGCIQLGHGIGLANWEPPIITRRFSEEFPIKLEKGMVIALETYTGKVGEKDAVRIEEECVVTDTGYHLLSRYPCEELISCPISHFGLP